MKILLLISLIVISFVACSKEEDATTTKKVEKVETEKEVAKTEAAPCDSKEDLIKKMKKLEEEKNAEPEKAKGFSLQGGDTGCKVK